MHSDGLGARPIRITRIGYRRYGATRCGVHHRASSCPSDSAQRCCAGRSFAHSSFIPGLLHLCRWPGLHSEQTSHTPWFPGSLPPRTAAHFAFVRPVELCEQITRPSQTDSCSSASLSFNLPSPLSGDLAANRLFFGLFPGLPGTTGPSEFLLSPCPYGQVHV